MNIQQIIFGTLGLQLTACGSKVSPYSTGDCEEYAFELSTEITANSVLFSGVGSSDIETSNRVKICSEVYTLKRWRTFVQSMRVKPMSISQS